MRMFLSVHPYKSINSQLALQMEITDHVKLTFSFTLDHHIFPQFQMFTKCKSSGLLSSWTISFFPSQLRLFISLPFGYLGLLLLRCCMYDKIERFQFIIGTVVIFQNIFQPFDIAIILYIFTWMTIQVFSLSFIHQLT